MKAASIAAILFVVSIPLFAQQRSFPNTKSAVYVFHDQLPGSLTDAQWQFAATHLTGCQKMIRNHVDKLRSYNSNFIILNYKLALGQSSVNGNGDSIRYIFGNNWVTNWWYVNQKTDWFLLAQNSSSRLFQPDWFWYLMDVSGKVNNVANGWKEHWLSTCIDEILSTGADGVFADSFDASLLNTDLNNPMLTPYDARLDGPALLSFWPLHLNSFASYVKNGLDNHNPKYYFLPNFGGMITTWDTIDYARYTHGGMVEGFAQWRAGNYFSIGDWKLQMNRILNLTNRGKILLLEPSTDANNLVNRMWLMGCYFLTKGEKTFITMLGTGNLNLEYYPEYTLNLGSYVGSVATNIDSLYDASWGVYRRDFMNGFVLVNPGSNSVTINNLGGTFHSVSTSGGGIVNSQGQPSGSLSSAPVTGITLPAHGAAILLNQPVPVELQNFRAHREGSYIILVWSTASETNNAGFEVERRVEELEDKNNNSKTMMHGDWEKVGFVAGHGTTTEQHDYSFTDFINFTFRHSEFRHSESPSGTQISNLTAVNLRPRSLLYRLKQIDYDGSISYSSLIEVAFPPTDIFAPSSIDAIYPNPYSSRSSISSNRLNIDVTLESEEVIRLTLYDSMGRQVQTIFEGVLSSGTHTLTGDMSFLHSLRSDGMYFAVLSSPRSVARRKFIVIE